STLCVLVHVRVCLHHLSFFFFSSRRRHTRSKRDWSSDVCSSDLIPMEKIVQVRREAKRKVFVTNAFRALRKVAPDHNLRNISTVVLVGGSAEDFEIPEMLMEAFTDYRVVCGRGNIRGSEGPRNAVATGLVLSYLGEQR